MADDTLVVICAIMGAGEARYMLDALRFIQLTKAKGVNSSNIHLFAHEDRVHEVPAVLKPLFANYPDAAFPLSPDDALALFSAHHAGDPTEFLRALPELASNPSIKRITIVLINNGSSGGRFGNADHRLDGERIVEVFNAVTKPTIIICSACYASRILPELTKKDCLKIWDNGGSAGSGISFNWGVQTKKGVTLELGTQLCFWLFDVLYDARETREIYMNLVQYAKTKKLECVIEMHGDVNLLKEPFFGPVFPSTGLRHFSILGILTISRSPMEDTKRPQFTNELTDIVDRFLSECADIPLLIKLNFWVSVYDNKFAEIVNEKPNGVKESIKIGRILEDKKLVTTYLNGAGLPDVLVAFELGASFLKFLP